MSTQNPFDSVNQTILTEIRQYHERALATDAVPSGFRRASKSEARKRWIALNQEQRDQEVANRGIDAVKSEIN